MEPYLTGIRYQLHLHSRIYWLRVRQVCRVDERSLTIMFPDRGLHEDAGGPGHGLLLSLRVEPADIPEGHLGLPADHHVKAEIRRW